MKSNYFQVRPNKVLSYLILIDIAIAALSLIAMLVVYVYDLETGLNDFLWRLGLDEEASIPTLYASLKLMACAIFTYFVCLWSTREGDRFAIHWRILSAALLYISVDEIVTFRELLGISLAPHISVAGLSSRHWSPRR